MKSVSWCVIAATIASSVTLIAGTTGGCSSADSAVVADSGSPGPDGQSSPRDASSHVPDSGAAAADAAPDSGEDVEVADTSTPPVGDAGTFIKWNPGHYMASYAKLEGGGNASESDLQFEMDDLDNQDAVLGYRMLITWGALEPTQGNYDFSVVDAVLNRLKTAYNRPKHLVVMLWDYGQGALGNNDDSVIPLYIQKNSIYGASPSAGSYGWWGKSANGASTGQYAPALYYAPVMDRFVALMTALGNHFDQEPYFEAVYVQEDATIVSSAAGQGSVDPHYSDAAWLTQLERLLAAATKAFPHTSVIMANTFFAGTASAVSLEQWMAANRIVASAADSQGQSAISKYGGSILSPGLATYIGQGPNGGTVDLRPKMTAMMDVESGDMSTDYFKNQGGPYAPLDIVDAMNGTYAASHAFWTRMTGDSVPAAAQWPNLVATISANPLKRTAYPANYP